MSATDPTHSDSPRASLRQDASAPVLRAETRRLILEAVERGCRVTIAPDGTICIETSGGGQEPVSPADLIDWGKPRRGK